MITVYRAGDSMWHRMRAGRTMLLLFVLVLGVCLLPASWWSVGVAALACVGCYSILERGMRELARQVWSVRWIVLITLAGQLLFLGPERAVANTTRVVAAIVIAALLTLTTPLSEMLDALERGLRPVSRLGMDPQRTALLLAMTVSTLPVLARLAAQVREAQRARGAGKSLRHFAIPFLIVALKHADQLGDALTARGVR